MQKLDKSAIEIVQIRLQIAWDLKALYNAYDSSSTNTFYLFIKEEFGLNKRSYQYYQSYFRFLVKYPLFQRIPVAFTFLRRKSNYGLIQWTTLGCPSTTQLQKLSGLELSLTQLRKILRRQQIYLQLLLFKASLDRNALNHLHQPQPCIA